MTSLMTSQAWVSGIPVPSASKHGRVWKEQLRTQLSYYKSSNSYLELEFILPESITTHQEQGLANFCAPVFSVLASKLGWFNGKQVNIDGWCATKASGDNTGLTIKQVGSIDDIIPQKAVVFDKNYYGELPRSVRDSYIPIWLQESGETQKRQSCGGLSLTFVNINRSITSLSDGMVKHVIDSLYPLIGGTVDKPNDYQLTKLCIKREQSPGKQPHIRIVYWDYERVKTIQNKFDQYIKHLLDELYIINEYLDAYISLHNKQVSDLDVLNQTPGFFQLTLHAFLHQFAVMLCRMYENNQRDKPNSISSLIEYLSHNGAYICMSNDEQQDIVGKCKALMDAQSNNNTKIKKLRDKALTHNDKEWLDKDVWKANSPTIGEYRSMIEVAHEILCIMGNLINRPTPMLGMGIENDIDWLIINLKRGYEVFRSG